MEKGERKNVYEVYDKIASWFSNNRFNMLLEQNCLDELIAYLPLDATVLDLGCGTGKPIMEYLINKEIKVTGVDASYKMLEIAKTNFPKTELILQDMRFLNLGKKFNAIIAWHSFFHLPATDQPNMFSLFKEHIQPQGILIFTSGTSRGEAWGMNGGENLFHASLDPEEYESLLNKNGFKVLKYAVDDPNCYATFWFAQYSSQL